LTLFYGLISIGIAYACLYWALISVSASMTMVTLALVPLLTLLFAAIHRIEPFRWRGLLGAVIALAGILLGLSGQLGGGAPLSRILALAGGAACIAEGSVLYKRIPKANPVATNALSVSVGAGLLVLVSLIAGEAWVLPSSVSTWGAFLYLILVGSVLLFYLYLYVLGRWTASATSYSFLLFPLSTIIIATLLTDEAITPLFILGGLLVSLGVWIGTAAGPPEKAVPSHAHSNQ
jgi:drug/metabolite transporter (DMT)-like permease